MRVVAGVLTRNAASFGRREMLRDTVESLGEADSVIVVDNGSDDGSQYWCRDEFDAFMYRPSDGVTTCGRGMNILGAHCRIDADVVVLTSDDMIWRAGWRQVVESFWSEAGNDVILLCGLLEGEYPWNSVIGSYESGGVTGLMRECVPGSGWTFRASSWDHITPIGEQHGHDDVPACQRFRDDGLLMVAVDIATHVGEESSTWGNESHRYVRPLATSVNVTRL